MAPELLAYSHGKALIGDTGYRIRLERLPRGRTSPQNAAGHRSKPERLRKLPVVRALYAKRYLVECFFHNLKRFRAIATRFEKTARNFLALTQLACAWLSWDEN